MSDSKRLEDKVDKISERIGSIDTTLAGQAISLDNHIARTDALQTIVLSVNRKVTLAEGALKLIGFLAIVAGILEAIKSMAGK